MDAPKILKVIMVASDQSGPMYHVLFLPSSYFNKYNLLQTKIVITLEQAMTEEADIIQFQRQYVPEVLMYIRMAKKQGKILMTNVDDNIWNLPLNNPAKKIYSGDTLARYEQILREVDATTTSTPYLKKLTLPFNKNCYVERNLVEPFLNEFVSPGKDRGYENIIRIGWHLTPHHADDAELLKGIVPEINKRYTNVKWIMMGWLPPAIAILNRNLYEYYDFVPVDSFYPALASLDFDIGIAPLQNHPFNWGKTHRKFSEYAILGIPCVISPVIPYLGLDKENVAILPEGNTTENWIKAISYLIDNIEERENLARRAYHWVIDNQDINKWIGEHAQIFYSIYNKIKGTNLQVPGYEDKPFDLKAAERIQNLVVVPGVNDC